MSNHALGVYWAPGHMRQTDMDYIAHLQPPAIRILEPDASTMTRAHMLAPRALLLPRDWALSEQHDDMRRDPVGTGRRHAQDWRGKIDAWRGAGMTAPDSQIVVVGINEPRVWESLYQTVDYTVAFLDECTRLGLRGCALNLSVGWPGNHGPDTPPDWTPYAPVQDAIKRGRHFLVTHEYWYRSGPQDGAGWWAWRLQHCPWDVPVIIGECGIDNYVDNTRWNNEGKPPRGWHGNVNAATYADQMVQYVRGLDNRVVAVLPFLTDYRAREWESFDTGPAHADLLARAHAMQPQGKRHTAHVPIIVTPPAPEPDTWQRSRAFVAKWEGGYQNVANDSGNWTGGKVGVGENKGTNFGISAASYPHLDIKNLTRQQADDIYRRDYWQASGADALPWPLCLLVFDTAVLHGVGTARAWLAETGPNPLTFAAKRLDVYTKMSNWDFWGKAWVLRVADLLREMAS